MAKIPENTLTMEDLALWSKMQEDLRAMRAAESLLRMKIFKAAFPAPVEGTNKYNLAQGWVLKAVYGLDRKVDVALLKAMASELREGHIAVDEVVRYKPEVAITEYKKMTDEQRQLFDRVLTIKPGSPQMEIVLPARAATAAT
jgi:hypothetical protein